MKGSQVMGGSTGRGGAYALSLKAANEARIMYSGSERVTRKKAKREKAASAICVGMGMWM